MSSSGEIERLQADVRYYHDRVALLRAKLYRLGQGSNARLRELERELERAQQRLTNVRGPRPEEGPAPLSGAVGAAGREGACFGPAETGRGPIAPPRRSPGSARDAEISEGPIRNDFGQPFASRIAPRSCAERPRAGR